MGGTPWELVIDRRLEAGALVSRVAACLFPGGFKCTSKRANLGVDYEGTKGIAMQCQGDVWSHGSIFSPSSLRRPTSWELSMSSQR